MFITLLDVELFNNNTIMVFHYFLCWYVRLLVIIIKHERSELERRSYKNIYHKIYCK